MNDERLAGQPVFIDWMALEDALETNLPEVRSYFNVSTGAIVQVVVGGEDYEAKKASVEEPGFVFVEPFSSRLQYRWMEQFIDSIEISDLKTALTGAINGKGAFRRFKDALRMFPEERKRWFEFRDRLIRDCVEEWLTEQHVTAENEPPWRHEAVRFVHNHQHFMNPKAREQRMIQELKTTVETFLQGQMQTDQFSPTQAEELARELLHNFEIRARVRAGEADDEGELTALPEGEDDDRLASRRRD